MEPVIGNCSKHPGNNFVNCPLCAIEKMKGNSILSKERIVIDGLKKNGLIPNDEPKEVQPFFKMQHFPEQEKGETFSKTVLVFDESENTFCDLGYYDFEKSEWVVLGDMSMKLICWCYLPDPTEFLKTKNYKIETHRGYC